MTVYSDTCAYSNIEHTCTIKPKWLVWADVSLCWMPACKNVPVETFPPGVLVRDV